MSEENPDYICPSCMWQGGDNDDYVCPSCGEELQSRKEYDEAEAISAHDDALEDERLEL